MSQTYKLSVEAPGRQVSTTSVTPILNSEGDEMQSSYRQHESAESLEMPSNKKDNQLEQTTISSFIPIREEFRCRRSWFFYHDIRVFVTSWIPLPMFLVWRLFVFLYIFLWLILHINARNDDFGPRWLIYLTDLAYTLLVIGTAAICFLCIGYTIVHYASPKKLLPYFPRMQTPVQRVYQQDNIPWFVKICWALYIVGASLAPLVTAGYWILVYRPCPPEDMDAPFNASIPDSNQTNGTCLSGGLDVFTVHFHGVNVIIIILDLFLSRIPFQFMHFFYPLFFQLPYVIFTLIYWGAGGTNPGNEERYIYSALDYSKVSAIGFAIALVICPIPFYWIMFLLAWLRDVVSKHVSRCFRNIEPGAVQTDNETTEEPEITIL